MRNKIFDLILLLMLTGSIGLCQTKSSGSQDQRTLKTKVADILTEMPAQDEGHLDKLMNDMISIGEPGMLLLIDMLQPPGGEDDSRVRFALNGLAKYVTVPGLEKERTNFALSITEGLEKTSDKFVRTFLINQLQVAGGNEVVPALGKHLNDGELCEPAAQALLAINTSEAEAALLDALGKSTGPGQITIVKALGKLNSVKAQKKIEQFAGSGNSELRKVSLYALANTGSLDSEKILFEAANETGFKYEETGATSSYMLFIERIGEAGETNAMERMCNYLLQNAPSNIRSQILSILIPFKEASGASLLMDAMDDPDPHYRATALELTNRFPGEGFSRIMLNKLYELSPEVQAEMIAVFGNREDEVAGPAIFEFLYNENPLVRLSAIKAAGKFGGDDAATQLLAVLPNGNPGEVKAIKEVLFYMKSDQLIYSIYETLDIMPPNSKAALYEVLTRRDPEGFITTARKEVQNTEPEIRLAAYSALSTLATPDDKELMYRLFTTLADSKELTAIQAAILSFAKRMNYHEQSSFLAMFSDLDALHKPYFYEILPETGGKKALEMVMQDYYDGDEDRKEFAFVTLVKWKDLEAIVPLFDIIRESEQDDYRVRATDKYLELLRINRIPDEQKVLLYRKLFEVDPGITIKNKILNNIGSHKIFQSLVFAGQFLDDPELQQEAVNAVIRVALPSRGRDNGMTGTIVTSLLRKAEKLISGEDSPEMRQRINDYLSNMPGEEGFVSLFNGQDLTGWQGLVENPVIRAKMDPEALAEAQNEANLEMGECWSVKDGVIWFNGKGANLCTVKKYGDFELLVDWKITKNGDSGIYLRGSPQVQIWDTSRTSAGAQVGSGGLYNNQINPSKPLVVADNPVGDWNTFRIRMIGERVTVWLNGQLVVDNVIMENYWDRNQPIFPMEQIELQAHGTNLGFRDIYIREIPRIDHNKLSDEEIRDGFVQLFNGKDLGGWIGNKTDYVVEDGMIVIYPDKGGHGNLYTEKEYSDFNFRFEFLLTPGANNGLGIRTPLEGDAAYVGMELQILDNTAPIYRKLDQYQYHGSVYGVIPAKRGFLKPVGEWNSQEVIISGADIKVILNGTVIVDGNLEEASQNGTVDGNDHPGLKRETGHIGFLGHGSIVKFRNIRIKEL